MLGQNDGEIVKGQRIEPSSSSEDVKPPTFLQLVKDLPVINLSKSKMAAHYNNPANKPKLDFKPNSKWKKSVLTQFSQPVLE